MKICLIGNMNNNNFSLMRYFRTLGADAHLFLYVNDGQGTLSHFRPECDTWEIDKWQPYIHQTRIPNAPVAAVDFPCSWLIGFRSMIRSWCGCQEGWIPAVSRREIRSAYDGYDRLIASGISPAALRRCGIILDIFYPYSTGVEFLQTAEFLARFDGIFGVNRWYCTRIARRQAAGIRAARIVLNAERGITHNVLLDIGVEPRALVVPMVFDRERLPMLPPTSVLRDAWEKISNADLTLLHQSRLMWSDSSCSLDIDGNKESKNNNWLLNSIAALVRIRPDIKLRLLIIEYGPDVAVTKQLAYELGIDSCIHWLPKMDRRELMWLLSRVSIGVGAFSDVPGTFCGGAGWEALASGKPLLQGFTFELGEFEKLYGYPPPPMLPVSSQEDILIHLLDMADHPEKREEIGRGAKEWFDRYNGIGLAKQWLDLLLVPREDEGDMKRLTVNEGVHG